MDTKSEKGSINKEIVPLSRRVRASVASISAAIMLLEIGLTRIFSVMYDYHYAFLLISLTILGIGAGGIYHHVYLLRKEPNVQTSAWTRAGSLGGLSIMVMLLIINIVPALNNIFVTAALAFWPFFFGGLALSGIFRTWGLRSGTVYAWDLLGASVGALMVIPALRLGGNTVALLAAMILCGSSLLFIQVFRFSPRWKGIALGVSFLGAGLLAVNLTQGFPGSIPFSASAFKEMAYMQSHPAIRAEVEETRWSHFGRTDLVANKLDPFQKTFFIDGTAGASMFRLEGDLKNPNNPALELLKRNFSGYFALSMIPDDEKQKVLIIGPGGGRDVLVAKMAGSGEITAVEINGDMVAMARARADYNGGIYSGMPGVKVVVSEGRSYLKREGAQYDVIYLSIPITKTSRSPEGFALSESFLFTTDAIKDYLAHLTSNGRLIVVAHDPLELFKLLVMVLDAWKEEGVRLQEALRHIYTAGSPHLPMLVVKRSPIGQAEAQRIHDEIMNVRHYPSATTYIPGITQHAHRVPIEPDRIMEQGMMNEVILSMAEGKFVPEDVIEAVPFNMRPATDESPFFFKIEKGVPNILITLLILSLIFSVWAFFSRIRKSNPVTNSMGPGQDHVSFSRALGFRILFASLGTGFMLVEIPLIQKFSLFLGEPTYSLSITVLSLLVGGGLGSMASQRLQHLEDRYTIGGSALLVALGVVTASGWSEMIFEWLLGESIVTRAAASAAMLIPLGFVMGIPFPSGIRLLSRTGMSTQIPLIWGINGAMSVTGSVGSMILAIQWGFTVALITGASLYLFVFLLFVTPTSWRRPTVMAS